MQRTDTHDTAAMNDILFTVYENRRVTVFDGMAMYESSGRSSGFSKTWFPLQGALEASSFVEQHCCVFQRGWIIKPAPGTGWTLLAAFLRAGGLLEDGYARFMHILSRFGCVASLVASARLGGGYWDTEEGRRVADVFRIGDPAPFRLVLDRRHATVETPEQLNAYIRRRVGVV